MNTPLQRFAFLLLLGTIIIGTGCTKYTLNNRCCENDVDTINTKFVLPDSFTLYIPQAFTPNGDGKNDIFLPRGRRFTIELFEIKKRNAVVYSSDKHLEAFWNGTDTRDGSPAENGLYNYYIKLRLSNRDILEVKGNVCVIRFGEIGDDLYEEKRAKMCECVMGDMLDPIDGVVRETSECPGTNR